MNAFATRPAFTQPASQPVLAFSVPPTVLAARKPSAICPWTPRHSGAQRYKVTHGGTEKKRPG
jgi:hypothetical protein